MMNALKGYKAFASVGSDSEESEDGAIHVSKVVLGEESAPEKGAPDVAKRLSDVVRAAATNGVDSAWQKFQEEVPVQKMVWDAVAVMKKVKGEKEALLEQQLELAVREASVDRVAALARIEEILKHEGNRRRVSTSMLEALDNIPLQIGLTHNRKVLADRLAAATLPRTDDEKRILEKCIISCRLGSALDLRVREFLRLPLLASPAPGKNKKEIVVDDVKPLIVMSHSRSLYDIVGKEDTLGRENSNMSNVSTATSDNRPIRRERTNSVTSISSNTSMTSNASKMSQNVFHIKDVECLKSKEPKVQASHCGLKPLSSEASAKELRSMALNAPQKAWRHLRQEFETQQLVWQSVASTRKKDDAIATKIGALKSAVEFIFVHQGQNQDMALGALGEMLTRTEDMKMFNKGTQEAAKDVIKQHRLAPLRLRLAEKVGASSHSTALPGSDSDKQDPKVGHWECGAKKDLKFEIKMHHKDLIFVQKSGTATLQGTLRADGSRLWFEGSLLDENNTNCGILRLAEHPRGGLHSQFKKSSEEAWGNDRHATRVEELEQLVLACDLSDHLGYSVRKCLLLPIPEAMQLARRMSAAPKSSSTRGRTSSKGSVGSCTSSLPGKRRSAVGSGVGRAFIGRGDSKTSYTDEGVIAI